MFAARESSNNFFVSPANPRKIPEQFNHLSTRPGGTDKIMVWELRVVARKKKKEFLWSQMYDPDQDKNTLIKTLKRFWIPLLEQALEQARQLLEKLEKER